MKKQCVMMLQYLEKHGSITGLVALTSLGIISYTKVISLLRASGVVIESEYKTHRSRFGLKRFVQYNLIKVPAKVKKCCNQVISYRDK